MKYLLCLSFLILAVVVFSSCDNRMQGMMDSVEETMAVSINSVDVLIYTNASFWILLEDAEMAAETTRSLLDSAGIQVEITKDDAYIKEWMLQTSGDGNVNVIVLYGILPSSIYGPGNTQPDESIAENWIETTDGDTILNHADYIAYNTDYYVDNKLIEWTPTHWTGGGSNAGQGLQNLMDNLNISLFSHSPSMIVTPDGTALTPSLVDFESLRPIPLNQLHGEWFAEKIFASDTGDDQANYADPVIIRDGDRGRLAVVHATRYEGLPSGEVTAEIIANYLLAK